MNIKNVLFVAILLAVVITVSCKKDDEGPLEERVQGSWGLTFFSSSNCANPDENETKEVTCDMLNCSFVVITDSTYTDIILSNGDTLQENEFDYTLVGNTFQVCPKDPLQSCLFEFTVSVDGSGLTFQNEDPDDKCLVTKKYSRR